MSCKSSYICVFPSLSLFCEGALVDDEDALTRQPPTGSMAARLLYDTIVDRRAVVGAPPGCTLKFRREDSFLLNHITRCAMPVAEVKRQLHGRGVCVPMPSPSSRSPGERVPKPCVQKERVELREPLHAARHDERQPPRRSLSPPTIRHQRDAAPPASHVSDTRQPQIVIPAAGKLLPNSPVLHRLSTAENASAAVVVLSAGTQKPAATVEAHSTNQRRFRSAERTDERRRRRLEPPQSSSESDDDIPQASDVEIFEDTTRLPVVRLGHSDEARPLAGVSAPGEDQTKAVSAQPFDLNKCALPLAVTQAKPSCYALCVTCNLAMAAHSTAVKAHLKQQHATIAATSQPLRFQFAPQHIAAMPGYLEVRSVVTNDERRAVESSTDASASHFFRVFDLVKLFCRQCDAAVPPQQFKSHESLPSHVRCAA